MPLQPGDTLRKGQYRIVCLIDRGGFAFVYHARDTVLGLDVAIKELTPSAVGDPTWVKRFLVEARATIQLRDDHIVATHTLFAESGNHYLVMEYMPSGSLEDALQKKHRLPPGDAVRIAREVCEGLSYAHRRGIVHCDLKPANILFAADGTAKVADFGIAHVSSHGARSQHWATTGPFRAGTLEYMPPEQVEGERSDRRTDLYALGALLYHALTGRLYADFDDSPTLAAIGHNLDLIRHHQPAPPSSHNSLVPPWLDDLVLRLLAKRPEDRPDTASEVLALLSPRATQQLPPPHLFVPRKPLRLPKWAWYGLLVALLVCRSGTLATIECQSS
jgi:serine/threonine protein kinase